MTDELVRKYEELKAKEMDALKAEGSAPKDQKDKDKKALKKGFLSTIQIIFWVFTILFFMLIVLSNIPPIQDGAAPDRTKARTSSPAPQKKTQPLIARRTRAGVPIERGADIDYRIDSDKLIDLSVRQIRSSGYKCYRLSSIDLYRHNNSIVVRCNSNKDKYRIYPSSGRVTRE